MQFPLISLSYTGCFGARYVYLLITGANKEIASVVVLYVFTSRNVN